MTQQPYTPMYEIKNADDGDYTNGLIVCPWCAPKARAEGFRVTATVVTPCACDSCGRQNAPVPPYAVRKALRTGTIAVGRNAS